MIGVCFGKTSTNPLVSDDCQRRAARIDALLDVFPDKRNTATGEGLLRSPLDRAKAARYGSLPT